MRGQRLTEAAGAGRLDRVLDGPVVVLVVLAAVWLAVCVHTARRRPPGGPLGSGGRVDGAARAGAGGRVGAAGRAVHAAHAALAFIGAAGLLSQAGAATATPVGEAASTQVGAPPSPPPSSLASPPASSLAPQVPTPLVTLSVVTDGGEKVPSLWPVGREHIRERLAPVPGDRVVVVHRGDTLWSLARRHLGPGTAQAAIEQAVRGWYALNESVIGPDRDLILPGQVLHVPGATDRVEVTDGT